MTQITPAYNKQKLQDAIFRGLTYTCGASVIVIMVGMFVELVRKSMPSIKAFGFEFIWTNDWDTIADHYGAASSIFGTLVSTAIALIIAVPLSVAIALFLVELAPRWLSKYVGYAIELLAAIPSIIFGMWGLFVFSPFLADHVQPLLQKGWLGRLPLFQGAPIGLGMLVAGIILALMILPFISAVMRDIFSMVPAVVKEAGYGMGATTWEVTRSVTIPYGVRGLLGGVFLGLGRALGETMAVTFVIGNAHQISASLYEPGNSIASTLANEFNEADKAMHRSSLVELGLILFVITLLVQVLAYWWLQRLGAKAGKSR